MNHRLLGLLILIPALLAATPDAPLEAKPGEPGLDVLHYDLSLVADPRQKNIQGQATLDVRLSRGSAQVELALHALKVRGVLVDGVTAAFQQNGDRLSITLPQVQDGDQSVKLNITYSGAPRPVLEPGDTYAEGIGWKYFDGSSYALNQPDGAMSWFPCHDVPSDKATFTFHVTVPAQYQVLANGEAVSNIVSGRERTFTYAMTRPMATYLATVQIDRYRTVALPLRAGLTARVYIPLGFDPAFQRKDWQQLPEMLALMERLIGPYPYSSFSLAYLRSPESYALENQTLITFPSRPLPGGAGLYMHEVSHQWFGNSVTPRSWQDMWLNEGFAGYVQDLWTFPEVQDLDRAVLKRVSLVRSKRMKAPHVIRRHDLFNETVYLRGSLVLHALRARIGSDAFSRVLRGYYRRFAFQNAGTQDFIDTAVELSGDPGVAPFLHAWIYDAAIPDFPQPSSP